MNYKNELQEYFQKRQLPLPVYKYTKMLFNMDTMIKWRAEVKLYDSEGVFRSDLCTSKKKADQNAAFKALQSLNNIDVNEITKMDMDGDEYDKYDKYEFPNEYERLILVDIENLPLTFKHIDYQKQKEKTLIITVMSKFSSHYQFEKRQYYQQFSHIEVTNSGNKDAADTLLIFLVGKYLHNSCNEIIIISRDRFAATLKDILIERGFDTKCFTCYQDIQKNLLC